MMVDGKTLEKLQLQQNNLLKEVDDLRQRVIELEKKSVLIEALQSDEFTTFLRSLSKPTLDQEK